MRNGPLAGAVGPTDQPSAGYAQKNSPQPAREQTPRSSGRVRLYVDGFNLYYGMHTKFGRRYLWLDLYALGTRLLRPDQLLVAVSYFTARMRGGGESAARQAEYLGALRATGVTVVEGRFQEKEQRCFACNSRWRTHEEKASDVSLSVALVEDAANDLFDTALLLTADSDMSPAVRAARRLRSAARIIAVFPPGRTSGDLRRSVHGTIQLGATPLRQCQLPDTVAGRGRDYQRPPHWK